MRRTGLFAFVFLTALSSMTLFLAGCSTQDGPSLFNDSENLDDSETAENPESTEEAAAIPFEDGGEFGMKIEGTQCIQQLHGGCVPFDFMEYDNAKFGLNFAYPSDWVITGASDRAITVTPTERSGEDDPTQLFAWRSTGINEAYMAIQSTLTEQGTGLIGPYEVAWEIYEGEWNGLPVQSEWVWLTYDEDQPYTNYVFVLITETENFATDQAVLQAAVSSIAQE